MEKLPLELFSLTISFLNSLDIRCSLKPVSKTIYTNLHKIKPTTCNCNHSSVFELKTCNCTIYADMQRYFTTLSRATKQFNVRNRILQLQSIFNHFQTTLDMDSIYVKSYIETGRTMDMFTSNIHVLVIMSDISKQLYVTHKITFELMKMLYQDYGVFQQIPTRSQWMKIKKQFLHNLIRIETHP